MKYKNRDLLVGTLAILIACIVWGYGYLVIQDSFTYLSQDNLMTLRYLLASVCLALIYIARIRSTAKRIVLEGAVMGLFLYASQYGQTAALNFSDTTAGQVAFITALYVVIVPYLNWLFFKNKPNASCWIAAGLAIGGLYLLQGGAGFTRGCFMALLGSIGFSLHILVIDKSTEQDDPILLTVWQFTWAFVYAAIVQLLHRTPLPAPEQLGDILWPLIYLGVFSTMLGFLMQTAGQKRLPPDVAALLLSTEAVFGMAFSVAFAGEAITAAKVLGCILLLAAVLTAELKA